MSPQLHDSLQNFRNDLEVFFQAQKKHNATRQRLEDLYLRLLRPPVGIAGVGRSSESPDSKGSKAKRQAISLQELGGECSIRELLIEHLTLERRTSACEVRGRLQDVWVDELHETSARVSVLFSKPVECLQLGLQLEGGRWSVARANQESLARSKADLRDLWSPVAKEIESGRLLQDLARGLESDERLPEAASVQAPRKLVGKSPFFRLKDAAPLFAEIDADGDGQLSKEDLLPYLRDYLGYGHAEVCSFIKERGPIDLQAFKKGLDDLNAYAVHDRFNKLLVRRPGAFGGIDGVDFHLEDCSGCSCLICDRSEEVKVDALVFCRVLIGPCRSSSFIRNCENCTFWVATKQFRVRDCSNCTFYLHCHTEPVIESSKDLRIAPFCAKYPGLPQQFKDAGFDPTTNFWNAVYDFTGNAKHANWRIPSLDECEELVVTFEGCGDAAESPCPQITQELLRAEPLQSGESHGQSVANVPQTRPAPPAEPSLKRLRRCISDASQELAGTLEAVILTPRDPTPKAELEALEEVMILEDTLRLGTLEAEPRGPRGRPLGGLRLQDRKEEPGKPRCKNCDNTGIHFLGKTCSCAFGRKILADGSSDEDLLIPPRAKAKARPADRGLTSLDSDEEPVLTQRQRQLLKEGLGGLGARTAAGKPVDESSDDEVIIEEVKPAKGRTTAQGESSSESDDALDRWKVSRAR